MFKRVKDMGLLQNKEYEYVGSDFFKEIKTLTVRSINQSLGQGFDSLMLHVIILQPYEKRTRIFNRVLPCAKFLNLRTVDTGHYGFDCDNEK